MVEQKECINPDMSLSEMLHIRNGYKNKIAALKKLVDPNDAEIATLKTYTTRYIEMGEEITKLEKAANTGGIIRLM